MNKYKAIGFDMGGVLTDYKVSQRLDYIAEKLGVPYDAAEQAYLHSRNELETGLLSNIEFWDRFTAELRLSSEPGSTAHLWSDNYTTIPIDEAMIGLVKSLGANGYKTGMLSNIDPEHGEINRRRGMFKDFDVALFSDRLGYRKPDGRAYQTLCDELKVEPQELVFVDDLTVNIEGANAIGVTGIVFTTYHALTKQLKELGFEF